jgi:uronate dehydrogenase
MPPVRPPSDRPILLTGAAGGLGTALRPKLAARYGALRSSDIALFGPALTGEEIVIGDIADEAFCDRLCAGAGAVIHLGGRSTEDSWAVIHRANIVGCFNMFDAARMAGIKRVVFASSNHAIGFHPSRERLDATARQRPDSLYGVSKAFGEDLASLYVDKHQMEIACLRIGSSFPEPADVRQLATWLSYDDLFRLIVACLEAPQLGFAVMYGASNNSRGWWDNSKTPEIDFTPEDTADVYAAQLLRDGTDPRDPDDPAVKFQGGAFVTFETRRR